MKKLIGASLLYIAFALSCRKIGPLQPEGSPGQAIQRFFTLPASTSPEIRRVVEKLQALQGKHELVTGIAQNGGYPVWDKPIYNFPGAPVTDAESNGISKDTIIYIPLVLLNESHVNAFIYARLNGEIQLQLHRGKNFASYGFGNLKDSTSNAERLALQIMMLDKKVFGHSEFKLLDKRLFALNADGTKTSKKCVIIKDKDLNGTENIGHWEMGYNKICFPNEEEIESLASQNCITLPYYYFVYSSDFPNETGGGYSDPFTGGGGLQSGGSTGTGSTGLPPCNPGPFLENGLPLCPGGGSFGWEPVDSFEPPKDKPCDKVKGFVNEPVHSNFMQKVKDLAKPDTLNLNYEKSVALIDSGSVKKISENNGSPGNPYVNLDDIPKQKYTSIAHIHSNVPGGTYSVFSFKDLSKMSNLLYNKQLDAGKFVAFLSTYKGTHYALTISDKDKFEDFFYYLNITENSLLYDLIKKVNSLKKAIEIEQKYFLDRENPLITETDTDNNNVLEKFLDFMKEANLGVTLFESNANFTNFTKLEKDLNGQIKRTSCN